MNTTVPVLTEMVNDPHAAPRPVTAAGLAVAEAIDEIDLSQPPSIQTPVVPPPTPAATSTPASPWRVHDAGTVMISLLLLALGLVMMTSASIPHAERQYHDPLFFFWRHLAAIGIGIAAALWVMRISMSTFEQLGGALLLASVLLLIMVLVPGLGSEVNGSMRWLRMGGYSLQASELAKPFMVLYLAGYFVRHHEQVRQRFIGFIKPMLVMTIIAALLLLEPDYGAVAVLYATCLGMMFLAGVSLMRFISWGLVAACALATIAIMAPYRLARLMNFVDPWADPFASGFQLTQALIAFGRGEIFGVGLGNSVQKMFYLPEVHTDFVLAVIGEELGLFGTLLVIALFILLIWRALNIAAAALASGRPYHANVANGIALLIGLQAFINIGVNLGVLPTKGLTLPFISYGNNSLVMTCFAVGLLLRVSYETQQPLRLTRPLPDDETLLAQAWNTETVGAGSGVVYA